MPDSHERKRPVSEGRPVTDLPDSTEHLRSQDAALSAIAELMSSIERRLYTQWRAGYSLASLKNKTIAFYQIPARHFNAVKAGLEGKLRSVMTNLGNTRDSYQRRIKA